MSNAPPSDAVGNPADYFPGRFLNIIEASLNRYIPEAQTVLRPVKTDDTNNVIGIYTSKWAPDEDSYETSNGRTPTCNYYMIKIQNVTKSFDEALGRALHTNVAKMIRVILYRDPDFGVALLGLSEEMFGQREMVQRFKIMGQEFLSGKVSQTFMYLATTDILIETETSSLT